MNREKLIEVLIRYKINPLIIDMIIQMYEGDSTTIQLGKMKSKIEVTSGIKHGCAISTLHFKMITFTLRLDVTALLLSLEMAFYCTSKQGGGGGKPNLVGFNPYTYWTQKILSVYLAPCGKNGEYGFYESGGPKIN